MGSDIIDAWKTILIRILISFFIISYLFGQMIMKYAGFDA